MIERLTVRNDNYASFFFLFREFISRIGGRGLEWTPNFIW